MKKKMTVSIGIPAYNEEGNIKFLLRALLNQKTHGIKLEKILVVSDGSTDKTNELVKSFKDQRVKLIINKKRQGLNKTQNLILKKSTTDILVLLDADVLPQDASFLISISQPIINNSSIGIVSCKLYSIRDPQMYSRVLANSAEMRRNLYQSLPNPNNVYLCNGCVRAFSKAFYKKLTWPEDVPEDAYSYFIAKTIGFRFLYLHGPIIYFHTPGNLNDHVIQNKRFIGGKEALQKYFDKDYLDREYRIPKRLFIRYILIYLYKRPLSTPLYLLLMFYIKFFRSKKIQDHSRYEIAKSSKKIIGKK